MTKPNSFGAECSPDLIRRGYKMLMKQKDPAWEILSDPDWMAWLEKDQETQDCACKGNPEVYLFAQVIDYDDYN